MDSNEQLCRKWERQAPNIILTILPFFQALKNNENNLSKYISPTSSKTINLDEDLIDIGPKVGYILHLFMFIIIILRWRSQNLLYK